MITAASSTAPVYTVPQQPGTALTLDGRESTIIVADYDLGGNQLQYSTSQIMTNATIGGRDVAVLYGDHGSDGETVLHYAAKPTVTATGGTVASTWDPATGDLRLNYQHTGLTRVQRHRRRPPAAAAARRHRHRQDLLAAGHRGRPGAGPRHPPAARRGQPRLRPSP